MSYIHLTATPQYKGSITDSISHIHIIMESVIV